MPRGTSGRRGGQRMGHELPFAARPPQEMNLDSSPTAVTHSLWTAWSSLRCDHNHADGRIAQSHRGLANVVSSDSADIGDPRPSRLFALSPHSIHTCTKASQVRKVAQCRRKEVCKTSGIMPRPSKSTS
jgi:hypothetical protein